MLRGCVRRAGRDIIEAIIDFETCARHGQCRRSPVDRGRAGRHGAGLALLMLLETLRGFDDEAMWDRRNGERYSRDFGGANWLDQRNKALFASEDLRPGRAGGGRRPRGGAGDCRAARNLGIEYADC